MSIAATTPGQLEPIQGNRKAGDLQDVVTDKFNANARHHFFCKITRFRFVPWLAETG